MKMVLYNDIEVKMDKNYTFKIYFGKKTTLNIIFYIIKKYSQKLILIVEYMKK